MLNIGIIVVVLAASSNGVLGILTEIPQNAAILLYSKLQLNCSSDSSPSNDFGWAKRRQDGTFELLGGCAGGSSGDYDFIQSDPNSCDLVVSNATTAQNGIFRCVTNSESPVYASVSIIGEEPVIASSGDLNVTVRQEVHLSCNVSYLGDIVPLVNWMVPLNVEIILNDVPIVGTQVVMASAILTSNVEGQYNIGINVSFNSSSINIPGLDRSLAVYVSSQTLQLQFMPSDNILPTPPPPPPPPDCCDPWEIALSVIGCVCGVGLIIFVTYWCCRYHRHKPIFPCCDCCECCGCWNDLAYYLCCVCCAGYCHCCPSCEGDNSVEHSEADGRKTAASKSDPAQVGLEMSYSP